MKQRVSSGDVSLAVVDEGDGPPVLLLHGFPDNARLWRHQIPALTAAGYRAIAPDQRGFGESDKPQDVEAYAAHLLIGDVLAVLDARGVERAVVVGHDWGAALAWLFAMFQPDRVEKLVAVSVGAPGARPRFDARQLQRFWYMFAFQFAGVAEEALTRDGWELFREWTAGTYPDIELAIEELSRPGALTAGLNWYRANMPAERLLGTVPGTLPPVKAPVLGMWSTRDLALSEEQMLASERMAAGGWRYERFEGIGHWIPLEAPERFNDVLLDFIRE